MWTALTARGRLTGSMPAFYRDAPADWETYYHSYVDTYLQRDIRDLTQVADEMAAGINPAKWICAQADDIMVGSAGNVAMLVMVDSQLGIPAQSVADAFVAAAGEGASAWVPETIGQPEGIPAGEDSGAELQPAG